MSDDIQEYMLSHCLAIKTAQEAVESYMDKMDNALMKPGMRLSRSFIRRKRSQKGGRNDS